VIETLTVRVTEVPVCLGACALLRLSYTHHILLVSCCLLSLLCVCFTATDEAVIDSEDSRSNSESSAVAAAAVLAAVHSACADISSDVMEVDDDVFGDVSDSSNHHLSVQQLLCLLALVQQFPTGYFSDSG
jgi:hypothetical protein